MGIGERVKHRPKRRVLSEVLLVSRRLVAEWGLGGGLGLVLVRQFHVLFFSLCVVEGGHHWHRLLLTSPAVSGQDLELFSLPEQKQICQPHDTEKRENGHLHVSLVCMWTTPHRPRGQTNIHPPVIPHHFLPTTSERNVDVTHDHTPIIFLSISRSAGSMAERLASNQEVTGSTPVRIDHLDNIKC